MPEELKPKLEASNIVPTGVYRWERSVLKGLSRRAVPDDGSSGVI